MLTYDVKSSIVLLLEIVAHIAVDHLFALVQLVKVETLGVKALVSS